MTDEDQNNSKQQGEETTNEPTKPLNIVEEARAEREKMQEILNQTKEEREKLETLKANEALAGTVGGHVQPEPPKVETDAEYAKRIARGEFREDERNRPPRQENVTKGSSN